MTSETQPLNIWTLRLHSPYTAHVLTDHYPTIKTFILQLLYLYSVHLVAQSAVPVRVLLPQPPGRLQRESQSHWFIGSEL